MIKGCGKKLAICRRKGGRRGKCMREFAMCLKKCSGGKVGTKKRCGHPSSFFWKIHIKKSPLSK